MDYRDRDPIPLSFHECLSERLIKLASHLPILPFIELHNPTTVRIHRDIIYLSLSLHRPSFLTHYLLDLILQVVGEVSPPVSLQAKRVREKRIRRGPKARNKVCLLLSLSLKLVLAPLLRGKFLQFVDLVVDSEIRLKRSTVVSPEALPLAYE